MSNVYLVSLVKVLRLWQCRLYTFKYSQQNTVFENLKMVTFVTFQFTQTILPPLKCHQVILR